MNGVIEVTQALDLKVAKLMPTSIITFTERKTLTLVTLLHLQTSALDNCVPISKFKVMKLQKKTVQLIQDQAWQAFLT